MTNEEKLDGFPTVHYPSLLECRDRQLFMTQQFKKYGLTKTKLFLTDRYNVIKDQYELRGESSLHYVQPGNIVSYITLIKEWYDTSEEEYAIFCDDDMEFFSVDYWRFTWKEFVSALPSDWECIHLIRIEEWKPGSNIINGVQVVPSLDVIPRKWDHWGTAVLITKEYAKKILDRHYIDDRVINYDVPNPGNSGYVWSCIENVLLAGLGTVYSFPIFIECTNFSSFGYSEDKDFIEWNKYRYYHIKSSVTYRDLWASNAKQLGSK